MLAKNQARAASEAPPPDSRSADSSVDDLANLCKASGDHLRLQILQVLRQDSLAVQELCAIFNMRQPALSHHLKVMSGPGLITSRREGNSIFYRRAVPDRSKPLGKLHDGLLSSVDAMPLSPSLAAQLATLRKEREQSSKQFFRQNADKFRAQQDLIASYEQYADTVAELVAVAPIPCRRLALEVGPGDGAFLAEISPQFDTVVALDNSSEMLAKSESRAAEAGLENIEFVLGDTGHPGLEAIEADCIVVNMVLHHTPSPADILVDLARCLAPAGVLLITDLCRHDQDWAREACGDLWQGFEPAELLAWAESAGLVERDSVYLAQRNGFQIQVRLFGHPQDTQGSTV